MVLLRTILRTDLELEERIWIIQFPVTLGCDPVLPGKIDGWAYMSALEAHASG